MLRTRAPATRVTDRSGSHVLEAEPSGGIGLQVLSEVDGVQLPDPDVTASLLEGSGQQHSGWNPWSLDVIGEGKHSASSYNVF